MVARPIHEDEVVAKVGGRFKLAALLQKRLRELTAGAQKLVETESRDPVQIVYQEILEDKIALTMETDEDIEAGVRAALEGSSEL
jgi:DNA-directed RNA polymerase subunit omega